MSDAETMTAVVKRIVQTMKKGEKASTRVAADYVIENDPDFKTRHQANIAGESLFVDVHLKGLCTIHDLYKDKSVFYKTLKRGQGTASPYFDCRVTLRVKIDIDGENKLD